MQNSETHPFNGLVHVDEFYIGEEGGIMGRSLQGKKKFIMSLLNIPL